MGGMHDQGGKWCISFFLHVVGEIVLELTENNYDGGILEAVVQKVTSPSFVMIQQGSSDAFGET